MITSRARLFAPLTVACLSLVLAGCGSGTDAPQKSAGAPSADPLPIEGDTTFVVTRVQDKGSDRPLVEGSQMRLQFVDGRLVITAGCNTMSSEYQLKGAELTVAGLATTQMGCEPSLMDQDVWVGKLFEAPVQLTSGKHLRLVSGDVVLTLADRKEVSPDKPLVATTWELDGLVSTDAASSVPSGVTATLQISAEGVAVVHDGCNRGRGEATVAGDTITWGERASTRMACPGKDHQEVQDAIAAVLSGATTHAIVENTLTVTRGDRALTFRAASATADQ